MADETGHTGRFREYLWKYPVVGVHYSPTDSVCGGLLIIRFLINFIDLMGWTLRFLGGMGCIGLFYGVFDEFDALRESESGGTRPAGVSRYLFFFRIPEQSTHVVFHNEPSFGEGRGRGISIVDPGKGGWSGIGSL